MKALAIVLAGGTGKRLRPLTRRTPKPTLPFGGAYRLIDFTLSNCINSGLREIHVLTQHDAVSLNRYLKKAWTRLPDDCGHTLGILPPNGDVPGGRYRGTADAVYWNLGRIRQANPDLVLILCADHVYRFDYQLLIDWHLRHKADVTLATTRVRTHEAGRFGIVEVDAHGDVLGLLAEPQSGNSARFSSGLDSCDASMGLYVFSTNVLYKALEDDFRDPRSGHDFGLNVLPRLIENARVSAYDFSEHGSYWRDVGTIEAYHEANMDMVAEQQPFKLHDAAWLIHSLHDGGPPARFEYSLRCRRQGMALDSLVSSGCVISGARAQRSVLGANVTIGNLSDVDRTVIFPEAKVGARCRIHNAIIDYGVEIPDDTDVGFNLNADRRAGYFVSDFGVVVVTAANEVPSSTTRLHASV